MIRMSGSVHRLTTVFKNKWRMTTFLGKGLEAPDDTQLHLKIIACGDHVKEDSNALKKSLAVTS